MRDVVELQSLQSSASPPPPPRTRPPSSHSRDREQPVASLRERAARQRLADAEVGMWGKTEQAAGRRRWQRYIKGKWLVDGMRREHLVERGGENSENCQEHEDGRQPCRPSPVRLQRPPKHRREAKQNVKWEGRVQVQAALCRRMCAGDVRCSLPQKQRGQVHAQCVCFQRAAALLGITSRLAGAGRGSALLRTESDSGRQ